MSSSTQSDISNSGFARRGNGSCFSTETDCGKTATPFHACCPSGSFCPHQYNVNCCPTAANCTQSLLADPQCANRSLDLYDNNGYFCCLHSSTGGASTSNSDICAEPGYSFNAGEELLSVISSSPTQTSSSARPSNPSTVISNSVSSPVSSPSNAASIPPPSHSHTGAIAGGVAGGIGVIVIILLSVFFFRKRSSRRRNEMHPDETASLGVLAEKDATTRAPDATELPGSAAYRKRAELTGSAVGSELPASTDALPPPFELPSH